MLPERECESSSGGELEDDSKFIEPRIITRINKNCN